MAHSFLTHGDQDACAADQSSILASTPTCVCMKPVTNSDTSKIIPTHALSCLFRMERSAPRRSSVWIPVNADQLIVETVDMQSCSTYIHIIRRC